jgi:hypothetical protein
MAGFVPLFMLANRGVEQQDRRVKGEERFPLWESGSRSRICHRSGTHSPMFAWKRPITAKFPENASAA